MDEPQHQCENKLCAQFRMQHRLITQKRNELEKELDHARKQHAILFNQVVTRGEQTIMREAATGEAGVRLPNGEIMTPEKFMSRTKMMNQCRDSLQVSEKRARQFAEENTRLKQERDSIYATMRKYEDMLHGFDRARHYDVFSDELHRQTVKENHRLVDQVERLRRSERETKEENRVLRRRLRATVGEERRGSSNGRRDDGKKRREEEMAEARSPSPPLEFRKRKRGVNEKRVVEDEDEEEPPEETTNPGKAEEQDAGNAQNKSVEKE